MLEHVDTSKVAKVEYGRLRVFDPDEGEDLAKELLSSMADRTSNISLILQCNVGVIAGYHLLVGDPEMTVKHPTVSSNFRRFDFE